MKKIVLFLVLSLAFLFRFYNINWDQNQHLHPDERFLTMVANGTNWPKDFSTYLDTQSSPLNPHNRNFGFFVYGTFPLFLTKYVAEIFKLGDYNNLTLVGRSLSALFDLGTVLLVFLIAKTISSKNIFYPLISAFFYAIAVLPIQLSHFFAVDTFITFFVTLAFYLIIKMIKKSEKKEKSNKKLLILVTLTGIAFGLALASKVSALLLLPVIILAVVFLLFRQKKILFGGTVVVVLIISTYFSFRIAQPYAFADKNIISFHLNPKFIENMKSLKSFDSPKAMFPPAVQWLNTPSFTFPFKSIVLQGLGPPMGVIAVLALGFFIGESLLMMVKRKNSLKRFSEDLTLLKLTLFLSLLFITTVFIYQGSLYTKNMRYFVMMYPELALLSGYFLYRLYERRKTFLGVIVITILIWPIAFFSIYQRPHPRVFASYWIYENIPPKKTLAFEHWDDPLPLPLSSYSSDKYNFVELPLYDPDVEVKWKKISENLEKTDYIIMSSNRLWGSIPRVPERYPIAPKYYQALFDGTLGFTKVAEITSYPCFPSASFCLLSINDSQAEESFTVYDHPKVLIYQKIKLNSGLINKWLQQSKKRTTF